MEGFRNEGFVEIAVVEYPGGDPSAASVLAEMAHVANRLAQQQRRPFKRVLVTRWIVPARLVCTVLRVRKCSMRPSRL